MNNKTKSMLASYGRSMIAAVIAVYSTGNTDPKALVYAAMSAVIPVFMRWLNPNDPAYGRSK